MYKTPSGGASDQLAAILWELVTRVTWQQHPGILFLTITALFLILLLFDD